MPVVSIPTYKHRLGSGVVQDQDRMGLHWLAFWYKIINGHYLQCHISLSFWIQNFYPAASELVLGYEHQGYIYRRACGQRVLMHTHCNGWVMLVLNFRVVFH